MLAVSGQTLESVVPLRRFRSATPPHYTRRLAQQCQDTGRRGTPDSSKLVLSDYPRIRASSVAAVIQLTLLGTMHGYGTMEERVSWKSRWTSPLMTSQPRLLIRHAPSVMSSSGCSDTEIISSYKAQPVWRRTQRKLRSLVAELSERDRVRSFAGYVQHSRVSIEQRDQDAGGRREPFGMHLLLRSRVDEEQLLRPLLTEAR